MRTEEDWGELRIDVEISWHLSRSSTLGIMIENSAAYLSILRVERTFDFSIVCCVHRRLAFHKGVTVISNPFEQGIGS
jgi:hypothetical protein